MATFSRGPKKKIGRGGSSCALRRGLLHSRGRTETAHTHHEVALRYDMSVGGALSQGPTTRRVPLTHDPDLQKLVYCLRLGVARFARRQTLGRHPAGRCSRELVCIAPTTRGWRQQSLHLPYEPAAAGRLHSLAYRQNRTPRDDSDPSLSERVQCYHSRFSTCRATTTSRRRVKSRGAGGRHESRPIPSRSRGGRDRTPRPNVSVCPLIRSILAWGGGRCASKGPSARVGVSGVCFCTWCKARR
ncbi:hypothetical protein GQ53DRAFT_386209 [Thozetella sp. PMI_491]|nr:hypothetical protein GQ53DRAFT_386209 [Thozetella sp. PMI_491]